MKLIRLLKTETTRMLVLGFAIGSIGLAVAQPSTAQVEQPAVTRTQ